MSGIVMTIASRTSYAVRMARKENSSIKRSRSTRSSPGTVKYFKNGKTTNKKDLVALEVDLQRMDGTLEILRTELTNSEGKARDSDARNKALWGKHIEKMAKLNSQYSTSMGDTVNKHSNEIKDHGKSSQNATRENRGRS